MRFESVKAYAFGRLRDETLELAPGMNVIYGPNEAGKSTWHAALYAGLCGMRRGPRARSRSEDSDFQTRHKPWDGEGWEVGATIALQDRRVVLRHDLDGRVDSSAHDADLAGHEYSSRDHERWRPRRRTLARARSQVVPQHGMRAADEYPCRPRRPR